MSSLFVKIWGIKSPYTLLLFKGRNYRRFSSKYRPIFTALKIQAKIVILREIQELQAGVLCLGLANRLDSIHQEKKRAKIASWSPFCRVEPFSELTSAYCMVCSYASLSVCPSLDNNSYLGKYYIVACHLPYVCTYHLLHSKKKIISANEQGIIDVTGGAHCQRQVAFFYRTAKSSPKEAIFGSFFISIQ